MGISILISTYNYDCSALVDDLRHQCTDLGIAYEIIVGDDCSTDKTALGRCRSINSWDNCRLAESTENKGAAANRNALVSMSKYSWLIFLDSDAEVRDKDFIKNYIENKDKGEVVVGGLLHPTKCPNPEASLRYKYEVKADKKRSASIRSLDPYAKFTAFNIMVDRHVFDKVKFNENCKKYGYEDILFAFDLKKNGIKVAHIDNPMTHVGLDPNEVFLRKTETALRTLNSIEGGAHGMSNIENVVKKLEKLRLAWGARLFFNIFNTCLRRNLLSDSPSLTLFSLYKLGYLATLRKRQH